VSKVLLTVALKLFFFIKGDNLSHNISGVVI
jgi:hypothetical protein